MKFYQKIDVNLHTTERSFEDLQLLRHCGVTDVITSLPQFKINYRGTILDLADWLFKKELKRGKKAGLNIHPAIGISPNMVTDNMKELDGILRDLEQVFKNYKSSIVAVGNCGLERGTQEEFIVFKHQLGLARSLNLPVIIQTPSHENKKDLTKVIMRELRKQKIQRALILNVTQENIAEVLSDARQDIKIGLCIQNGYLKIKDAIQLYKNYSYENRFCITSVANGGNSDILSLVKGVEALGSSGFNSRVIEKLCYDNALDIFGSISRKMH